MSEYYDFLRDFFKVVPRSEAEPPPKRELISFSNPKDHEWFITTAKDELRIAHVKGSLIIGCCGPDRKGFIQLVRIPSIYLAEHILDMRPVLWWQLRRRWKRLQLGKEPAP